MHELFLLVDADEGNMLKNRNVLEKSWATKFHVLNYVDADLRS